MYQLYKLYQALYQPLAIYHPNRGKLDGAARKSSKEAEVIDPELLEAEAKEAKARKYGGAAWSRWRLGGFSIQQKCIEMLHECILNYFDVFSKFQDADLKTGFAWFDGECARDLYIITHTHIYIYIYVWCCSVTLLVGNGACSADIMCLFGSRVLQSPMVYDHFACARAKFLGVNPVSSGKARYLSY